MEGVLNPHPVSVDLDAPARWLAGGVRDFVVGTARWGTRVTAYVYLLTVSPWCGR